MAQDRAGSVPGGLRFASVDRAPRLRSRLLRMLHQLIVNINVLRISHCTWMLV